ncbi:NUDIX domain-containing protein [Actinomadura sp. HBU206391]|uniref:NUDIX domain-containing protein n=1 Tax=Actinomadura sp. HBU206391 TaxID=2731692 RepID=UPI001650B9DF|nr:NUDIX hydrolase [Actinomadura sp. HBU206391]MBC6462390.1 NUDIX hydrolase [Actinomadura sp. HBU206391]
MSGAVGGTMRVRDTPERWEVVDGIELCAGHVFRVRRERVRMPRGDGAEVVERDVVVHPGSVGVLALDDEDRVLLIRQYRHPAGHLLWEAPAGLRDVDGEPLWRTAEREFAEEAGYRAERWHTLVDTFTSPGMSDERQRIFLARGLSEIPAGELDFERVHEEADMPAVWVPLDEAVAKVLGGELHNPTAVTGILAAYAARANGFKDLRPAEVPEG